MQLVSSFLKSFMVKSAVCFIRFQDTQQDLCVIGRKLLPIMTLISSNYDCFTK